MNESPRNRSTSRFGRSAVFAATAAMAIAACGSGEDPTPLAAVLERQSSGIVIDASVNPALEEEVRLERFAMARRDLAVELIVPEVVEAGEKFDVHVRLSVATLAAQGVDLAFVLPDGVEIVKEGVCPIGEGEVECEDAVAAMELSERVTVEMVWNPKDGSVFTEIEISVSDEGIATLGIDAADGNPDNNWTTARLDLLQEEDDS